MECFSSIDDWDPQPMKQWKSFYLRITGIGILYNLVASWLQRLVEILYSRFWVKGNLRWASWIVTLAPPSLWAQINDFISCACFFFFLISQFLFLVFYFQRYMSSEALGILHSKSGAKSGGRMRQRDKYLDRHTNLLHKLCVRFY